jgi:hypothetical protein
MPKNRTRVEPFRSGISELSVTARVLILVEALWLGKHGRNAVSKRKIILDCDPGHDDAVTILLALASPEAIDLLGITCVAGNVPLKLTRNNALKVCELAGHTDVAVYSGCARPMVRELNTAENVHGESGLNLPGGGVLPEPSMTLRSQHAVDYIIETLTAEDTGSITLCPIGPLTNIAVAMIRAPEIVPRIREIVLMGGAAINPGNVTPAAEFGCPNHRQSNVGQGPNWAQGYRTGVLGCQGLNNVVNCMLRSEGHRRLRQYAAPRQIQSRVAVHIFGRVEHSDHGSRAARIHGDISMTCQFADFKRIVAR